MSSRIIAVLATVTGLALVPGVASADGKHRHHHHHHAHKARVKVFTSRDTASGDSTDTNATAPAGQVTIASFTGGKLTLQLADGTTSGRVTSRTEIKCDSTAAPATVRSHGDDEGDAPDQQQAGQPDQPTQSDQQRQSGQEQDGDDDANGDAGVTPVTTTPTARPRGAIRPRSSPVPSCPAPSWRSPAAWRRSTRSSSPPPRADDRDRGGRPDGVPRGPRSRAARVTLHARAARRA